MNPITEKVKIEEMVQLWVEYDTSILVRGDKGWRAEGFFLSYDEAKRHFQYLEGLTKTKTLRPPILNHEYVIVQVIRNQFLATINIQPKNPSQILHGTIKDE